MKRFGRFLTQPEIKDPNHAVCHLMTQENLIFFFFLVCSGLHRYQVHKWCIDTHADQTPIYIKLGFQVFWLEVVDGSKAIDKDNGQQEKWGGPRVLYLV